MSNSAAGAIRNVNALPLIYGMDDRSDLMVDSPRRVVALFEQGQLDVALLPSIEVAKHEGWEVLLECGAIACDGPSRTMLIISRKPWDQVQKVAMDLHGRVAGLVAQVLLTHHIAPRTDRTFDTVELKHGRMPDGYDAIVVSGELALCWPGYDAKSGVLDDHDLELIDLGESWSEWTGLPLVSLVWVARETRDLGEWHEILHQASGAVRQRLPEVAEFAAERLQASLEPPWLAEFFDRKLVPTLTRRHREGLIRLFNEANALGLAPVQGSRAIQFRPIYTDAADAGERNVPTDDDISSFDDPEPNTAIHAPAGVASDSEPGSDGNAFYAGVIDHDGPDPYLRARGAFQRRRYRSVLSYLEAGERRDSKFGQRPEVALLRGQCELHLRRDDDARRSLFFATHFPLTERLAHYLLARLDLLRRDDRAASLRAREILQLYPDDISYTLHAHAILAGCTRRLGLIRTSTYHRQLAERRGLTSSDLLIEHGKSLADEGQWDDAAAYFGEAVNVDPSNPEAYQRLSQIFFLHGQWLKAEEILAYGIDQAPEEVPFFLMIGDLRREQNKQRDAQTLYRVAYEHSPTGELAPALLERVAHCLYQQNEMQEARAQFQQIAQAFPSRPEGRRAAHFATELEKEWSSETRRVLDDVPAPARFPGFEGPRVIASLFAFHGFANAAQQAPDWLDHPDVTWPVMRKLLGAVEGEVMPLQGTFELVEQLIGDRMPVLVGLSDGELDRPALIIGVDPRTNSVILRSNPERAPEVWPWSHVEESASANGTTLLLLVPSARRNVIDAQQLTADEAVVAWLDAEEALLNDDLDAASAAVERSIAADSSFAPAKRLQASIAIEQDRPNDALTIVAPFAKATNPPSWINAILGDAHLAAGNKGEALHHYRVALESSRRSPSLWAARGAAYQAIGNDLRARHCYERSLYLQVDPRVAREHATLLERADRPVEAAFWWEVVNELDPNDPDAIASLADYDANHPDPRTEIGRLLEPFVRQQPIEEVSGTVAGSDHPIEDVDDDLVPDPTSFDVDDDGSPLLIDDEYDDEDDDEGFLEDLDDATEHDDDLSDDIHGDDPSDDVDAINNGERQQGQ